MKKGFDAEKYIALQSAEILKRVARFGRLYLEVGGKLCYDEHAARVLPGYKKTTKIEMLKELGNLDIVYCINAGDLASGREVGLSGFNFKEKALGDLKDLKSFGFDNVKVVVTMFSGEDVKGFVSGLKKKGYEVYFHDRIEGYGSNMAATLRGYDKNEYVKLDNDLVIVTGVGGGSGKMGFCLSQIYKERKSQKKHGKVETGFAKFESFPIWNLPMTHEVNLAYEAATADLGDYNMIDKFHMKAYKKRAVNYNRDVENFEILMRIARKVSGTKWPCGYRSPTDMGVNMMREGIVDDLKCRNAGRLEIKRRLKKALKGSEEWERIRDVLKKCGV